MVGKFKAPSPVISPSPVDKEPCPLLGDGDAQTCESSTHDHMGPDGPKTSHATKTTSEK